MLHLFINLSANTDSGLKICAYIGLPEGSFDSINSKSFKIFSFNSFLSSKYSIGILNDVSLFVNTGEFTPVLLFMYEDEDDDSDCDCDGAFV